MRIKKFHGRNMRDSLEQMRRELGDEAIILSSREIHEPGNLPVTEVVAGIEPEDLEFHRQRQRVPAGIVHAAGENRPDLLNKRIARDANVDIQHAIPAPRIVQTPSTDHILNEIRELKIVLNDLRQRHSTQGSFLPPSFSALQEALGKWGFSDGRIQTILAELFKHSAHDDVPAMLQFVREQSKVGLRCANPLRPGQKALRVAVCGAPGSGKSSLVAKLSASFALTLNARSQVFCQAGTPFPLHDITGLEAQEYSSAIVLNEHCSNADDVDFQFVEIHDSLGNSTAALIENLSSLQADVVLCCISSAHHPNVQQSWIGHCESMQNSAIVLTQLDCQPLQGSTLERLADANTAIAFITDGKSIPQSIKAATPDRLVTAVMDAA